MMSLSPNFAASQSGVAPIRLLASAKSVLKRRTGVPFSGGRFASAPCSKSNVQTAACAPSPACPL